MCTSEQIRLLGRTHKLKHLPVVSLCTHTQTCINGHVTLNTANHKGHVTHFNI